MCIINALHERTYGCLLLIQSEEHKLGIVDASGFRKALWSEVNQTRLQRIKRKPFCKAVISIAISLSFCLNLSFLDETCFNESTCSHLFSYLFSSRFYMLKFVFNIDWNGIFSILILKGTICVLNIVKFWISDQKWPRALEKTSTSGVSILITEINCYFKVHIFGNSVRPRQKI